MATTFVYHVETLSPVISVVSEAVTCEACLYTLILHLQFSGRMSRISEIYHEGLSQASQVCD